MKQRDESRQDKTSLKGEHKPFCIIPFASLLHRLLSLTKSKEVTYLHGAAKGPSKVKVCVQAQELLGQLRLTNEFTFNNKDEAMASNLIAMSRDSPRFSFQEHNGKTSFLVGWGHWAS